MCLLGIPKGGRRAAASPAPPRASPVVFSSARSSLARAEARWLRVLWLGRQGNICGYSTTGGKIAAAGGNWRTWRRNEIARRLSVQWRSLGWVQQSREVLKGVCPPGVQHRGDNSYNRQIGDFSCHLGHPRQSWDRRICALGPCRSEPGVSCAGEIPSLLSGQCSVRWHHLRLG